MNTDTHPEKQHSGLNRRQFIQLGLVGGAVVSSGATLAGLSGCSREQAPAPGHLHLRQSDLTILTPMVPVLLGGTFEMTDENVARALREMDRLLDNAAPAALIELRELLDGLRFAPVRRYITGSWRSLTEQNPEQMAATIERWSRRNVGLSRMALRGIAQPMQWAWYITPEGAAGTGYPGPPQQVSA